MTDQPKRPADAEILKELRKRGDTLVTPRHTLLYFYRKPDDARDPELTLNPLSQRLIALGWSVSDLRADAVIVESERAVDAASVDVMCDDAERLAAEFDVQFDGWDCQLVQGGKR